MCVHVCCGGGRPSTVHHGPSDRKMSLICLKGVGQFVRSGTKSHGGFRVARLAQQPKANWKLQMPATMREVSRRARDSEQSRIQLGLILVGTKA
mmetsp:Transcript_41825/g.96867  ORF Transcript_41825/g.96867 Transcript_41825/m.96867 type:complete len:94 (-) Transcript_41825:1265-1546(-)